MKTHDNYKKESKKIDILKKKNELYVTESLNEGLDDIKNGKVKSANQVLEDMKKNMDYKCFPISLY